MEALARLVEIVTRLRGPEGCEWDRAQDLQSMRPYLLEEVYEVLDAIEGHDRELEEELGDLLFVVLLLVRIGEDEGRLDLERVARGINHKMVSRHPHVFADDAGRARAREEGTGVMAWENRKAREAKAGRSRLDGVPRALPALLRAHRQGEKAAATGFDWREPAGVMAKVEEELAELREAMAGGIAAEIRHELGDLLMAVASLGRHLESPPEEALREANDRFALRFGRMEAMARAQGGALEELDDAGLDRLWEAAKRESPTGA